MQTHIRFPVTPSIGSGENRLTSIEVCAGAGGQAIGLEQAGFQHVAAIEIDPHACATLRANRPSWNIVEADLTEWVKHEAHNYIGVDVLAGGVPCPPFSVAGKQLGPQDERDLFPTMVELTSIVKPRAVMIENVKGLLSAKFDKYREKLANEFHALGYQLQWKLLHAADYGVPQLRPRAVGIALPPELSDKFSFPSPLDHEAPTVGETLKDLMGANGWPGASAWATQANKIAPTIVGGSKKHGGPDLGPTRAKQAWTELGVDGKTIGNEPPAADFVGPPKLTVRMVARLQGFPDDWEFFGAKTHAYRQVGNAFPPPVAAAVAKQLHSVLQADPTRKQLAAAT